MNTGNIIPPKIGARINDYSHYLLMMNNIHGKRIR